MKTVDLDILQKNFEKLGESIKVTIPDFKIPEFNFPSIDTGKLAPLS